MQLKHAGDVRLARASYLAHPTKNLTYLFEKRFGWMQRYLTPQSVVVEVGCGAGLSTHFLQCLRLILTDYEANPWVQTAADALRLPFRDHALDGIIANNVVHHVAHPLQFFAEARRALKLGGVLIIQEINCSWLMQWLLRVTHHEGFNFHCNVFNLDEICTNPKDLWDANCAIPNLLFDDPAKFFRHVPGFAIEESRYDEVLLLPLSGGVIAKAPTIECPLALLKMVDRLDQWLIHVSPQLFPLQRHVALRKVEAA